MLTEDQLQGLVEEYCTRYHGLNDAENPMGEQSRVMSAVRRGDLVVWFDPWKTPPGWVCRLRRQVCHGICVCTYPGQELNVTIALFSESCVRGEF